MTELNTPWFYWELPPTERVIVRAATGEEEGYLANAINWGRCLVTHGFRYEALPEVLTQGPDPREDRLRDYSDPIAAILQAAAYIGLDPKVLVAQALATRSAVFERAVRLARQRVERGGDTR